MVTAWLWRDGPVFFLDDAWITIHNARLLFASDDPSFPGQPPLASATSLVHTVLVATVGRLGVPWPWAIILVSWAGFALLAAAIVGACRDVGLSSRWSALAAGLGVASWYVPFHWFGGLETSLAMAAVAWLVRAHLGGWRARYAPWIIGILPWLRPDLALAAPLAAFAVWRAQGRSAVVAIAAASAPWPALMLSATGAVLPATVLAKRYYFGVTDAPWDFRLYLTGWAVGYVILQNLTLVVGGALAWLWTRTGRWTWLAAAACVAPTLWSAPHVLMFNHGRYVAPLIPWALLGLVALARSRPLLARSLLLVTAGLTLVGLPKVLSVCREGVAMSRALDELSNYVEARAVPGPILIHDAGHISEHTSKQFVDAVGLKTPLSVNVHRTIPFAREEGVAAVACRVKARSAIVIRAWEDEANYLAGLRRAGWRVTPRFATGSLRVDYVLYDLEPPADGC
jgi:hypothetical protein